MADISKITLPNNTTYNIKDSTARTDITNIKNVLGTLTGANAVVFRGVSTTAFTDGGDENPTVNGSAVTTKRVGDVYFYGTHQFIYGADSKWHQLGSLDILGDMAYADQGTVTITPHGTISLPNFVHDALTAPVAPRYVEVPNGAGGTMAGSQADYAATHGIFGQTTNVYYIPEGTVSGTMTVSNLKRPASGAGDYTQFVIYGESAASTDSTYQPQGSVTITESSSPTTTIKNPTSVTVAKTIAVAAPGATAPANNLTYYAYDATDEVLKLYQLGYTTGASITTSNVSVKKGDASYTAAFTGEYARLYTNTKITADDLNITGRPVYLTAHGTPSGYFVSDGINFTGTQETWDVNPKTS